MISRSVSIKEWSVKVETSQIPINRQKDKQNVVYACDTESIQHSHQGQ